MYFEIISQCARNLKNIEGFLLKAQEYAIEKNFDVGVLMNARLAPDMKPLIYQVQSACDYLKGGAAWLSGQEIPRHADTEQTIDELRARIVKTLVFVESIGKEQYSGADQRTMTLSWEPGKVIAAPDYALQVVIPNVNFHIAMAYAILRNNGVDVGKMDFLGKLNMIDA
ncbi:DUF1993 family protein [Pseudomonas sp. URIL14HWK12:I6]|uniref:DUF1993 domain-containing protein n=1 Tax=Pseudomonas sp. URIL14HWK12:I6 TaxID=1283293 RepID=UPI000485B61D|nr:DUF1993 domain-containing protein [Pseudomonas sp. URIL14HWK12:I6]